MDPQCFDADLEPDPDPAQNLDADPDPDPGGERVGQPKMCIPPGKILGTPLHLRYILVYTGTALSKGLLLVITVIIYPV